jgi:hypothetical protein
MKRIIGFTLQEFLRVQMLMWFAVAAFGQSAENKAAATRANKPKKVIANDDIKSSPFTGFGGSIDDCDANCFEQVQMMAHVTGEKNATWRQDVLEKLDALKSDSEWQTYLHELYDAHRRVCQVTFDKLDELRRSGNARNMGPQEIAISENYDAQMKSAQVELNAAVARQSKQQRKFADNLMRTRSPWCRE